MQTWIGILKRDSLGILADDGGDIPSLQYHHH